MALQFIHPIGVPIKRAVPKAVYLSEAFYLGYGRHAWNWTWTNKYMRDCVSLSLTELQQAAERMRVQGSTFNITSVPILTAQYGNKAFGVIPINERSEDEYTELLSRWQHQPIASFWRELPSPQQNWMLILDLKRTKIEAKPFTPQTWQSRSIGGAYPLRWEDRAGKKFDAFLGFVAKIVDRFNEGPSGRNKTKKKEMLCSSS